LEEIAPARLLPASQTARIIEMRCSCLLQRQEEEQEQDRAAQGMEAISHLGFCVLKVGDEDKLCTEDVRDMSLCGETSLGFGFILRRDS
jgi:hypothetical protein